jgi:hypothetical protein
LRKKWGPPLIEKLLKNPPAEVQKLFASHTLAKKGQKDAETKLDKLGSMTRSSNVATAPIFARSSSP